MRHQEPEKKVENRLWGTCRRSRGESLEPETELPGPGAPGVSHWTCRRPKRISRKDENRHCWVFPWHRTPGEGSLGCVVGKAGVAAAAHFAASLSRKLRQLPLKPYLCICSSWLDSADIAAEWVPESGRLLCSLAGYAGAMVCHGTFLRHVLQFVGFRKSILIILLAFVAFAG